MKITILAPNLDLTPALNEYIEQKIGGLEKFLKKFHPENTLARVEVGRGSRHHRHGRVYHVDVNLLIPGATLRAEHDDEDVRKAINIVREKLQREIGRFKESYNQ